MRQNKFWLRLIGTAFLLHSILILISILEVAVYSYLISPAKDQAYYSAHATVTGPWISAIFGSLLMFLFTRRFLKRFSQQQSAYAIGLPVIYHVIDLAVFFVSGHQFRDFIYPFVLATAPKIIAVAIAYFRYSGRRHRSDFDPCP